MNDFEIVIKRLIDGKIVETRQFCHQVELLLSAIDKIYDEAEQHGGYATFSTDGNCKPVDKWESVMTIWHEGKVLCPVSAGGTWTLWDKHRKARSKVIMEYENVGQVQ